MCDRAEGWDSPLMVLMERGLPVSEAAVYANDVGKVWEERFRPLVEWAKSAAGLLGELERENCSCTDEELCRASAGVLLAWWDRQGVAHDRG